MSFTKKIQFLDSKEMLRWLYASRGYQIRTIMLMVAQKHNYILTKQSQNTKIWIVFFLPYLLKMFSFHIFYLALILLLKCITPFFQSREHLHSFIHIIEYSALIHFANANICLSVPGLGSTWSSRWTAWRVFSGKNPWESLKGKSEQLCGVPGPSPLRSSDRQSSGF